MEKIKSFTQLKAWQKAHKFVLFIYLLTKDFPEEEKFGLVIQMRRAAVSITSNIAEGFGRRSKKEKVQFYTTAKTSNLEIQSQLLIGKDLAYITKENFNKAAELSIEISRLISGLIKSSLNSQY